MKVVFLFLLLASVLSGAEKITSFHSRVTVFPDGWLDVVETIVVRVEGKEIRRGIFRDFPQTYQTRWGFREKRPFEVESVTRNGRREAHQVNQIQMGTRVLIGSEDVMLPRNTEQIYEIRYRTRFQLITGENGVDELYWNVTGNEWGFPIDRVSAVVEIPSGITIQEAFAWTGPAGAKGRDYTSDHEGNRAVFESTKGMGKGEGMTVIVKWPTGLLEAAAYEKPGLFESNPGLVTGMMLVGAGLLFYVVMWFLVGRDPPKGVIIPRWEPPEGFTPGGVRYLRNLRFDDLCFSAGLLGLAAEGHLKMDEKNGEYSVTKKGGPPPMSPVAGALFSKLFRYKKKVRLVTSNHATISGARTAFAEALVGKIDRSYFLANFNAWLPGITCGLLGMLFMLMASANGDASFVGFFLFLVLIFSTFSRVSTLITLAHCGGWNGLKNGIRRRWGVLLCWVIGWGILAYSTGLWVGVFGLWVFVSGVIFHNLIKRPTKKGRRIMDEIEGFREYLKVAEEDRLNLENPPEKTPELFEKFLPFALALDVEQEWSEKFDEVLRAAGKAEGSTSRGSGYQPSYYTGDFSRGSQALTAAALGGALTSALTSAAVAPSSTGSSGGGFSSGGGGGFSGGGGGGGGGGGW
ncbi:MAG: DUF2207 domain-containing protein [Verrucomicrobiaceae bacterium]